MKLQLAAGNSGQSRRNFLKHLRWLTGAALAGLSVPAFAASPGKFNGRIIAEWLPDGRKMQLVEEFEFIDPEKRSWLVPKGTKVDGASIPQVFWSVMGGPFEGLYRGPSVVHDFYCSTRTRKHTEVHKMFHHAMLSAGVGTRQAWLMYQAVLRFGPQWDDPHVDPKCEVVDDNYDFEKCARNSTPPKLRVPKLKPNDVDAFIAEMQSFADQNDLAKIRAAAHR